MLKVAAYCRVSTDKDDQANSFEAQQRYFRECIARNPNWELQGIYADEGLSGTSTRKRVEFNRMICCAENGEIDLIITKEVSRFARNTVDALKITRELRRQGVGVLFLNDNIDTRDHDSEFRLSIMSSVAQEESRKTSDRSKWGQMRSMERGVVFGPSLLGYDVRCGKISVNPEGAKIVQLIFHKYLRERKGCGTIARELKEAGILSSRGNCSWSAATVTKILKNEKYCGDLVQKKTYTPDFLTHEKRYNHGQEPKVVIKDHHEAIIDRKMWQAVQQELHRRNHAPDTAGHGNRYPLSGKITCGECGKGFVRRAKQQANGSICCRWCCRTAVNEGVRRLDGAGNLMGCSVGRPIREDVAMDILRRIVNSVPISKQTIISRITAIVERVVSNSAPAINQLEQDLDRLQRRSDAIMDRFLDHSISAEEFQRAKARCEAEIHRTKEWMKGGAATAKLDICAAITGIVAGVDANDDFYCRLLRQMTVYGDGRVEVALHHLPCKWICQLDGAKGAPPRGSERILCAQRSIGNVPQHKFSSKSCVLWALGT